MSLILSIVLFFVPHPLNTMLRRIFGQKIDSSAKIHIFTFLKAHLVEIGPYTVVGPVCIIKVQELKIGRHAKISPFTIISASLMEGANFTLGHHSRIFPFCWFEPGEGIRIGNHVGVGGHTLMFTHGVWSDYLRGGPVSFGSIVIEDDVWLPWRVFVMPGVTIGKGSVIGANSTVTKSVPIFSLAAGTPAKVVKGFDQAGLSDEMFFRRLEDIYIRYESTCKRQKKQPLPVRDHVEFVQGARYSKVIKPELVIDLDSYTYSGKGSKKYLDFIQFLRQFGIRLEEKYGSASPR